MKNHLHNYLLKLSRSGVGPDFASAICRYGKFTIYCLIGPEENILQVSFAPEKHIRLQKQLKSLNSKVHIRTMLQKEFFFDAMFADYFSGRRTRFRLSMESPLIASGIRFSEKGLEPYLVNTLRQVHYLYETG